MILTEEVLKIGIYNDRDKCFIHIYAPVSSVAEQAEKLSKLMPGTEVCIMQDNIPRMQFVNGELKALVRMEYVCDYVKSINIPYKGTLV